MSVQRHVVLLTSVIVCQLDAMLQLSAVLLHRRSTELDEEKEAMVLNLQRIQTVILRQQATLAAASAKKVRRNSITGSLKPEHRPSERRRSSVTPRGSIIAAAPGGPSVGSGIRLQAPSTSLSSFESRSTSSSSPRVPPAPPTSRLRGSLLAKFGGQTKPAPPSPLAAGDVSAETRRVNFASASTASKLFGSDIEPTATSAV